MTPLDSKRDTMSNWRKAQIKVKARDEYRNAQKAKLLAEEWVEDAERRIEEAAQKLRDLGVDEP